VSSTIDASAIDAVLGAAVESGAMPNVVAIAADRDGVIYEGSAGPRVAGAPDFRTALSADRVGLILSRQFDQMAQFAN